MVPRDARSCSTCYMICPWMTKTLMILSPSSTLTSRRLFRKCAVRSPLTRSRARLQSHGDDIPTIKELRPFLGYFNAMHSTASNNRCCYRDHHGHTHHVKGTTGGRQGDGLEMMRYSLSQHPIMGRVFARHRNARRVGSADDLNIYAYASLKTALKVLVEMRKRLEEDAKLSFNITKVNFTSPVSPESELANLCSSTSTKTPRSRVSVNSMNRILLNPSLISSL
jgi:hypothetical protein